MQGRTQKSIAGREGENGSLQNSRDGSGEDLFLETNIERAELGDVRVIVTSIMAETHIENFTEGGAKMTFCK